MTKGLNHSGVLTGRPEDLVFQHDGTPEPGDSQTDQRCRNFPNEESNVRLVTTYLMEYTEDWSVSGAFLSRQSIEATLRMAA